MRFKVFFNERDNEIQINCLPSDDNDIIIPENVAQHIHYPIPKELQREISKEMNKLIDKHDVDDYLAIADEIKELQERRRQLINNVRVKMNPLIVQKCEDFKMDHPEYFI